MRAPSDVSRLVGRRVSDVGVVSRRLGDAAVSSGSVSRRVTAATVHLLDGRSRSGVLNLPFVPAASDVVVEAVRADGKGRDGIVLAAERVACVELHLGDDARKPLPGAKRLRIHVAGGATFLVSVPLADVLDPVGFFGVGAEANGPPREVFFYAHGINAREEDAPIGEMLIEAGVALRCDVERGLATQSANRALPIGRSGQLAVNR